MITIYTDGSSSGGVDGPGGWAWWVSDDLFDSGGDFNTTNNRMELTAVIEAISHMGVTYCEEVISFDGTVDVIGTPLLIVSDSAYVVNCFHERWYEKWRANGWRSVKGSVQNRDLWEHLLTLVEEYPAEIRWLHCRGHGRGKHDDPGELSNLAAELATNHTTHPVFEAMASHLTWCAHCSGISDPVVSRRVEAPRFGRIA